MRFLFHLFGIIYFIIWTAIGVALLAGALLLIKVKPWQLVSGVVGGSNLGAVGSLLGNTGNIADVVKKFQGDSGAAAGAFNSIPKAQQDCLVKELGSKTVNDALAGKKIEPTPDMILKAMKCIK
ncbi:MAG: hypothetical protein HY982_01935 [Candidatus Magasanikbacteria bacterium]|nr:hypothetical protein [Candidatus Magasanikbacteria bacterium]